MKFFRHPGLISLLIGLLAGCVAVADPTGRNQHAGNLARSGGLTRAQVQTERFLLTSFARITRVDLPLTIYIEGDGFAWRTLTRPSINPTPIKALGLALASADPAPNVVYLARPCQFTPMAANPRCVTSYWTSKRFAEEVITAMNQAVTYYAARLPGQPIHLVGYSGGANVAVQLAARRQDVRSLRTVAGNLDVEEVNRLHRLTPMPASLNAIDVAPRLRDLPQVHYYGEQDTIVPPVIAQRFAQRAMGPCIQVRGVAGMRHDGEWARVWPQLLSEQPRCTGTVGQVASPYGLWASGPWPG